MVQGFGLRLLKALIADDYDIDMVQGFGLRLLKALIAFFLIE